MSIVEYEHTTTNVGEMTKTEAIDKVLCVLKNRMALMSKPMRNEAHLLCFEYQLSVDDLLKRAEEQAMQV